MRPLREVSIDYAPESIQLMGDFVLVKPDAPLAMQGTIEIPDSAIAAQKEYGLQRGKVVACGPGDRVIWFVCADCGMDYTSTLDPRPEGDPNCGAVRVIYAVASCPRCGSSSRSALLDSWCGFHGVVHHGNERCNRPMHVKPGDTVIFPRVPANRVMIRGEEFVMLHEEQHVLAVIEE